MTLVRPELLWLGLLAAPVVVLHLVRRRRRRLRIPSLLLWREVVAKSPRRFGARRLASLLSLLLVVLAIAAAVLASADPRTGAPARPPRPLLIALGASARMEGARFEAARGVAEEEIRRKAPSDPVTILLVAEEARVAACRETRPEALAAALRAARPSLCAADWAAAGAAFAETLAEGGRAVAVGIAPDVPAGVAVHEVGGGNAGLVGFAVRVTEATVEILAGAAGAQGGELVATLGTAEVRAPAGPEVVLSLPRGAGGLLRVEIRPPSGPAFDDSAEAAVPPFRGLAVGVADSGGGPDPFVRAALGAAGALVDADRSGSFPAERLAEAAASFDLVVLAADRAPGTLPRGSYLLLTPPPEILGFGPLPAAASAPVWAVAADHPVTGGVDAAEVLALGAAPALPPADAVPLLSLPSGAAAAAGERDGVRYVWIGLSPGNSTLPVTGAFPLLVRNALRWFAALAASPLPPAVRLGDPVTPAVALPPALRAVLVEGPGEEDRAVVPVRDGTFAFVPPGRAEGEIRVRIGEATHATRRNALLPGETSATARSVGGPEIPDRSGERDTERRFWPHLAAAALLLLLLEWFVGGRE